MRNFETIKIHMGELLTLACMVAACLLGADSGFAMAAVELSGGNETPQGSVYNDKNPEETVDNVTIEQKIDTSEQAQPDSIGAATQLPGKAATAGMARDRGLEASDIDPRVAKFRPFRFPVEWYIANKCIQQKVKSYVHEHFRSGATELDDTLVTQVTNAAIGRAFTIPCSSFEKNGASLTPCSEVFVQAVDAENGKYDAIERSLAPYEDGCLTLYVLDNDDENIKFYPLNYTEGTAAPSLGKSFTIPAGSKFTVGASACSESQMLVTPEAYLPESETVYLQKMNANVIITDEWNEMSKKVEFIKKDVLHNGLFNYKRKCARTHWLGKKDRIEVKVKELNGTTEPVYFSEGILRQIPNILTYQNNVITVDDFIAMTKLQFSENSDSNTAVGFCGKNALERIMKMAYESSVHNGKIEFQDITEMGINIHKWHDIYGTIEFVHDPTLDDIGYEDCIAVIDMDNAVRYFKRNEKQTTQDMKKTGESREAERTIISMIDCICLKGYNAILVCPLERVESAMQLGGKLAVYEVISGSVDLSSLDKSKIYYNATTNLTPSGTLIKYNTSASRWETLDGEAVQAAG